MSWTNEITIWCDGEDCGEWTRVQKRKVTNARRMVAENRGWECSRSEDLCPECKE